MNSASTQQHAIEVAREFVYRLEQSIFSLNTCLEPSLARVLCELFTECVFPRYRTIIKRIYVVALERGWDLKSNELVTHVAALAQANSWETYIDSLRPRTPCFHATTDTRVGNEEDCHEFFLQADSDDSEVSDDDDTNTDTIYSDNKNNKNNKTNKTNTNAPKPSKKCIVLETASSSSSSCSPPHSSTDSGSGVGLFQFINAVNAPLPGEGSQEPRIPLLSASFFGKSEGDI